MNYYEVLNSDCGDDINTIKRRYQDLVVKHHPDKNGGEQSPEFHRVRSAWETLSCAESRKLYDAELSNHQLCQESTLWCDVTFSQLREKNEVYAYPCKCSGTYEVEPEQVEELKQDGEKEFLLGCDTCSLNILVKL